MSLRPIRFGDLWLAPEALARFRALDAATREWGGYDDGGLPPLDMPVEIEPSRWAEGALWVWVGTTRYQVPAGQWRIK